MLRPHHTLTCPQCEQPGLHATADACLDALRAAVASEPPRLRPQRPSLAPPRPAPPLRPVAMPTDTATPLTINQACALLQVTRHCIYDWMQQGKLRWEYTPGGSRRIYRASLLRAKREVASI